MWKPLNRRQRSCRIGFRVSVLNFTNKLRLKPVRDPVEALRILLRKARLQAGRVMMWSMPISKSSMTTKRRADRGGALPLAAALFGCTRFDFRFGRASIFPLAQQPVNDSECDYRETQSDNSQRGCRLHIEDDEFSCERQNADEYHRLDLYDAVKALHGLEDAVIEFHGN